MFKSLPWILSLAFAAIIILMIVFKKQPPPPVEDFLAEQRLKENAIKIKELELDYDSLLTKMNEAKVAYRKADSLYQRRISRLTIRLNSINTTKATSKELDSLIKELYPD